MTEEPEDATVGLAAVALAAATASASARTRSNLAAHRAAGAGRQSRPCRRSCCPGGHRTRAPRAVSTPRPAWARRRATAPWRGGRNGYPPCVARGRPRAAARHRAAPARVPVRPRLPMSSTAPWSRHRRRQHWANACGEHRRFPRARRPGGGSAATPCHHPPPSRRSPCRASAGLASLCGLGHPGGRGAAGRRRREHHPTRDEAAGPRG